MNFSQKIKAGALQYVLVISVIIAIIIFAFISLVYLQQRMSIKHSFTKEAIANTQMGFEYLKSNQIPYDEQIILPLFENEEANTSIIKKHWGFFDIAIITSKVKNEFFQKIGLLGTQNSKRDALYLKDNNQSLVLVGNTKIIGNASIPKQGVKSGNIAGTSYNGNQLIYGNQKTSLNVLPEVKNIAYLKIFYKNYNNENLQIFELENGLKKHQSFTENTLLYESRNQITLNSLSLSGNILIVSKTAIKVEASTKLEDVILIAPKISVASNFRGNFQAIATKNIEIQSNCQLNYPTSLVLLEKENLIPKNKQQQKEENQISIAKNSFIKGIVLYHSENKASNYKTQIKIEENSTIIGEVYCTKNTTLLGNVFGSIYTNNFIIKKSGGTYVNHIYNGVINSKKLPKQYAGLQINQESNSVAKWLD